MPDSGLTAFGIGVLFLTAALFLPFFVTTTTDDATKRLNVSEGEDSELTETLLIEPLSVNETGSNATIEIRDAEDFTSNKSLINSTNTASLTLSNDTVNVTVDSITNNNTVLTAEYPPLYGFNDASRTFFSNIQLLLVMMGGIIILLSLGRMV